MYSCPVCGGAMDRKALRSCRRCYSRSFYIEEERGYATPCWIWQGGTGGNLARTGVMWDATQGKTRQAHRVFYERENGTIAEGLDLDHLCRVPRCVNPAHLEPVTHAENLRRAREANQ